MGEARLVETHFAMRRGAVAAVVVIAHDIDQRLPPT